MSRERHWAVPGRLKNRSVSAPILGRAAATGSIDFYGIPEGGIIPIYTSHPSGMYFETSFIFVFHLRVK